MGRKKWVYTTHHRKCRSNGGSDDESNLVRLPSHFHEAWHLIFKNFEAEKIAEVITNVYLDPEWELVAQKKKGQDF